MDSKETALKGLRNAFRLFLQDLEALPEEAFDRTMGGKAQTVADIVYEVNLVNDHVGLSMRVEPLFAWPHGWIVAPEGARTKDAAIASFKASSARIIDTVERMSPEEMDGTIPTEHGETTRCERCRFMTLHVWYHSGQLNFIQTLLGDDVWHWS